MKKYLLNYFVVATLLLCSVFAIKAQETKVILKNRVGNFYKISDNGKFVIGNIGTSVGVAYNVESDQLIYLTDGESAQSMANGITNEGVVYGQYNMNAAYYQIYWEDGFALPTELPLPTGFFETTLVGNVTADGKWAVGGGSRETELGFEGVPIRWNLQTGEVVALKIDKPNNVISGTADIISSNGEICAGRTIFDGQSSQKFLVGLWEKDGELTRVVPEIYTWSSYDEMTVWGANSSADKLVGTYYKAEFNPNTGYYEDKIYPYLYDVNNAKLDVYEDEPSGSEFSAISDDGLIIGAYGIGGIPNFGYGKIYENGKAYDLSDWLIEFYGCDGLKDLTVTGIPWDITPDGKSIVGTSGMGVNGALTAYIIQLGERKTCPKISSLSIDVLGNKTVQLSWKTPIETYGSEISGYNVYRNGVLINQSLLSTTLFTEALSVVGQYSYRVEVLYADGCSSGKSDPIVAEIYREGNCYAPSDLNGASNGESIMLNWEYPDFDLTYDTSNQPKGSIAAGSPDPETDKLTFYPFYFGAKWTEEEIEKLKLDGTSITDVSFFINAIADYAIVIFTNDRTHNVTPETQYDEGSVEIYRQSISAEDIQAGYDSYATFKLNEPIVIDKNKKNYYISIFVENYTMMTEESPAPACYDNGPLAAMWKSDLMSYQFTPDQPVKWMSLKTLYFDSQYNWVLSAKVSPKKGNVVSPSIESVPSLYNPLLSSYSIFRDGVEIAQSTTNSFKDVEINRDSVDYVYAVKANYLFNCTSESSNEITVNSKSVNDRFVSDVRLYPNPVENGVLYIDSEYKSITITDVQGRVILRTSTGANSVDISQLKRGAYFVRVSVEGGDVMRKIMVK